MGAALISASWSSSRREGERKRGSSSWTSSSLWRAPTATSEASSESSSGGCGLRREVDVNVDVEGRGVIVEEVVDAVVVVDEEVLGVCDCGGLATVGETEETAGFFAVVIVSTG